MWQASSILRGRSPFELLGHTEAEIDFILEMHALDHPDLGKFVRAGREELPTRAERDAAWERVLVGNAHHAMMDKYVPEALRRALLEHERRKTPMMQMGPASKKG